MSGLANFGTARTFGASNGSTDIAALVAAGQRARNTGLSTPTDPPAAPSPSAAESNLTLSLYDANGKQRTIQASNNAPAAQTSSLPAGWTQIAVSYSDGSTISVVQRTDHRVIATSTSADGAITYDSSNPSSNPAVTTLASRASSLLRIAAAAPASGNLSNQAAGVVDSVFGNLTAVGSSIRIVSGGSVSSYAIGAGNVVSAERTNSTTALETATLDGAISIDSVRNADGTGHTTIGSLTITLNADGTETLNQSSSQGGSSTAPRASDGPIGQLSVVDALGNQVSISGASTIDVTDTANNHNRGIGKE